MLDLEKKNRTGDQLLSGRQILDMAKRGTKAYRKALAFASRKWDIEKGGPKESGNSINDIIEFVRKSMYRESLTIDNDNEDVEGEIEQESEFIEDENETTNVDKDVGKGNVDAASSEATSSETTMAPAVDDDIREDDDDDVPDQYLFPSFMAFVLWGPFVEPEKVNIANHGRCS